MFTDNGIAERAVRRFKEGTSTLLVQSGLDEWWREAMECYCDLRSIQNSKQLGKTPYERSDTPFRVPMMHFGLAISYFPKSSKELSLEML